MIESIGPSRRGFLRRATTAGAAAALAAAPAVVPAAAIGRHGGVAAGDRVVLGLIGAGDFGRRHHLRRLLLPHPRVEVAAVCDVDQFHRERAARDAFERRGRRVGVFKDFRDLLDRDDLDAVLIAVPDHWHAVIAIAAMEAGKDVYCEKPLTLTIDEGKAMVAAARRYGTVFQTGSQQRSDSHHFRRAVELARGGAIGRLVAVSTHFPGVAAGTWQPPRTPPANLDWDFWLGPAPYADYSPDRCHYHFRWFADYSGGKITDHGAHHNDVAQWAIGADGSGPTRVEGTGTFHDDGPHDLPTGFEVTSTYGRHGGVRLVCTSERSEHGGSVELVGTGGWISVSRGGIKASDPGILDVEPGDREARLLESYARHLEDWLDCIRTRGRPACDVEIGHRSATVCHLANLAIRLGRPLHWDPEAETFIDDPAADRLLSRPMRAPWHL